LMSNWLLLSPEPKRMESAAIVRRTITRHRAGVPGQLGGKDRLHAGRVPPGLGALKVARANGKLVLVSGKSKITHAENAIPQ